MVCGREIVNLYFYSNNDESTVYCPKHRKKVETNKRVKAFLLMHASELVKEFAKAAEAVRIWKNK